MVDHEKGVIKAEPEALVSPLPAFDFTQNNGWKADPIYIDPRYNAAATRWVEANVGDAAVELTVAPEPALRYMLFSEGGTTEVSYKLSRRLLSYLIHTRDRDVTLRDLTNNDFFFDQSPARVSNKLSYACKILGQVALPDGDPLLHVGRQGRISVLRLSSSVIFKERPRLSAE